jgi:hypothetical protein
MVAFDEGSHSPVRLIDSNPDAVSIGTLLGIPHFGGPEAGHAVRLVRPLNPRSTEAAPGHGWRATIKGRGVRAIAAVRGVLARSARRPRR